MIYKKIKYLSCNLLHVIALLILFTGFSESQKETVEQNQTNSDPTRPNILLILSDDHSVPYLGSYGHPELKTPNLDQLAEKGVLFENAYTAAPQCVPSRATILTGRNVLETRMSRFSAPLPKEEITIPEYLDEAGYYTGISGRHYHLDGSGRKPPETVQAFEKHDLITFPERVDYLRQGADSEVLEQFSSFLDQVSQENPFFMWVNYSDPHRRFTADEYEPDPHSITIPESFPGSERVRNDLAEHYGEIMRLDDHVGQVLDELEQRGVAKNTIVLFMGDNGAALLRGKGTLYDLGIHVPLIVAGRGVVEGVRVDAMVSGIDIAPTILDLAGVAIPDEMSGESFLPALRGEDFSGREYIFATRVPHSSGLPKHTGYFDLSRTVFNKQYKLIYNALWQLPYSPVDMWNSALWEELEAMHESGTLKPKYDRTLFANPRSMFELYDLHEDPNEFNNLIENPEYADIKHRLKAKLQEWMIINKDYLPLPIPPE